MNYQLDLETQFGTLKRLKYNLGDTSKAQGLYSVLYVINYFSNRTELEDSFLEDYFQMTFSCLMESMLLLIDGYPRASLLTLRNGIDFFMKFTIQNFNKMNSVNNLKITESRYSPNKALVDKILKDIAQDDSRLLKEYLSLNSKLETKYGLYSQLVHSKSPHIKFTISSYIKDVLEPKVFEIDTVYDELGEVFKNILFLILVIRKDSFGNWDTRHLNEILCLCLTRAEIKQALKRLNKL